MKASVRWLNSLLEPGDLPAAEVEEALTNAGFPIDGREELPGGDVRLEVEITSNRGDCLSHVGLAREIAAVKARKLKMPAAPAARARGKIGESFGLENKVPDVCPRFAAHVIRAVKVGPSPAWLTERLESVGQRPINNVVDVTNYLNFLFGQPSHVFDLAKLAGRKLVVRYASEGEALTTLDGKKRKLSRDELVVADGERAQSLAGVIGGADSEVTGATRDVVLEAATWDPVTVRRAARRHQVKTDASHRFERVVDPRTIDGPAKFAAALIAELSGGTLCEGMLDEGRRPEPPRVVEMRTERCRAIAGVEIGDATMALVLGALGIQGAGAKVGLLRCTIPAWRPDLEREIDLIEEVARTHGLRHVPIHERVSVRVRHPQESEQARREIGVALAGLGFYEAVTFSFTSPAAAAPWLPPGMTALEVEDERRAHEPTLRPSVLTGLLVCRRANQDAQASVPGGLRLFEMAAVFGRMERGQGSGPSGRGGLTGVVENRNLALLMDVPVEGKSASFEDRQRGVRLLRGAAEAVVRAAAGAEADLKIEPAEPHCAAMAKGGYARVSLSGRPLGYFGLIADEVVRSLGIESPLAGGELNLDMLLAAYPPKAGVTDLPRFPSIERDLSLIVGEDVTWERVRTVVEGTSVERLEAVDFVGCYRGKQTGAGKKSVTLRMRFRDPARTLRHEEVDPQVEAVVGAAERELGAELRT